MKFTIIEELPKPRGYNRVRRIIEEFVESNADFAWVEIEEGEYKTLKTAMWSLSNSARKSGLPVKVRMIDKKIYLVRTPV